MMPTVTQIIGAVFRPYEAFAPDPWYLDRGTAVHACAQALCLGQTIQSMDARIEGHVEAVRRFLADVKPVVHDVEVRRFEQTLKFSGKPDMLGVIADKRVIVDWKCGLSGYEPIQLAGYGVLTGARWGMVVEVSEDGKYKTGGVIDISGKWKRVFMSALTVFNAIQEIKGIR